jgi:hypothetical protein
MSRYIAYYKIHPNFENAPAEMNVQEFFSTYNPVEILSVADLELVYYHMQAEMWSPHGEMREFIKTMGLSHTSMSVGDVIYSEEVDEFYSVTSDGFEILTLTN